MPASFLFIFFERRNNEVCALVFVASLCQSMSILVTDPSLESLVARVVCFACLVAGDRVQELDEHRHCDGGLVVFPPIGIKPGDLEHGGHGVRCPRCVVPRSALQVTRGGVKRRSIDQEIIVDRKLKNTWNTFKTESRGLRFKSRQTDNQNVSNVANVAVWLGENRSKCIERADKICNVDPIQVSRLRKRFVRTNGEISRI